MAATQSVADGEQAMPAGGGPSKSRHRRGSEGLGRVCVLTSAFIPVEAGSSSNEKLLFHILSAIAEYERELLIERTKAGRALAGRQGKICHRPRKEIAPKVLREMK
ncbi:MAG: recombinase family protein, partial [Candidatus Bipolaricaulia bacterium]